MTAPSSATILGPWVRLEGISVSQLPPGAQGTQPSKKPSDSPESYHDPGSAPAPDIKSFIKSVLGESVPFIDGVAPKSGGPTTWKSKGSPKKYRSSAAPVHLYERKVLGKELDKVEGLSQYSADRKDETWFCRRSVHKDAAEKGTATFNEFIHSFKEHHAESEKAFTPTVIGAREAMKWDTSGLEVELPDGVWNNITVVVEEMKHRIDPKPIKNRTFPVVQISASLEGAQEFVVVSIPINDFDKSPYAEFAVQEGLIVAAYVSIERIRILPANDGDIEWLMATASDAKGSLPQWMQNLAVPGAVAKDVQLFMSWVPSQRGKETTAPAPISKTAVEKTLPKEPTASNNNNPAARASASATETKSSARASSSTDKELPAAPPQ